jgi:hypothetical protein
MTTFNMLIAAGEHWTRDWRALTNKQKLQIYWLVRIFQTAACVRGSWAIRSAAAAATGCRIELNDLHIGTSSATGIMLVLMYKEFFSCLSIHLPIPSPKSSCSVIHSHLLHSPSCL